LLRLVKNLRGVIYATDPSTSAEQLRWVKRKFQYRTVGYTSSTRNRFVEARMGEPLEQKPFQMLLSPSPAVGSFIEALQRAIPQTDLVEVLCLASAHIAPVLLLGRAAVEKALPFSLYIMQASTLTDAEVKRHLRILDYAMLDAHTDSSHRCGIALSRAAANLLAGDIASAKRCISYALRQEKRSAEADCNKRFWRLTESAGEALQPTVIYLHPLQAVRAAMEDSDFARALARLTPDLATEVQLCLSVVPAFVVNPS